MKIILFWLIVLKIFDLKFSCHIKWIKFCSTVWCNLEWLPNLHWISLSIKRLSKSASFICFHSIDVIILYNDLQHYKSSDCITIFNWWFIIKRCIVHQRFFSYLQKLAVMSITWKYKTTSSLNLTMVFYKLENQGKQKLLQIRLPEIEITHIIRKQQKNNEGN